MTLKKKLNMEFIKNIKKTWILNPEYDILKNFSTSAKLKRLDLGEVLVKVDDIGWDKVSFKIIKLSNTDIVVDKIVESMIEKIEKDSIKLKKVLNKIIKEWKTNPDNFLIKKRDYIDDDIYTNIGLLNDNEYGQYIYYNFDKVSYYFESEICTGCGSDTYHKLEVYEEVLEKVDSWVIDECKKLRSKKLKNRIKNYLTKYSIKLTFKDVLSQLTLFDGKIIKNRIVPKFPIIFDGEDLNNIMHMFDECVIDEECIEYVKNDIGIDISALMDWEVSYSTKDESYNDGQICEYLVEFISPVGDKYSAIDNHCAMIGWSFSGNVEFK